MRGSAVRKRHGLRIITFSPLLRTGYSLSCSIARALSSLEQLKAGAAGDSGEAPLVRMSRLASWDVHPPLRSRACVRNQQRGEISSVHAPLAAIVCRTALSCHASEATSLLSTQNSYSEAQSASWRPLRFHVSTCARAGRRKTRAPAPSTARTGRKHAVANHIQRRR